jgi:hypothetical protein
LPDRVVTAAGNDAEKPIEGCVSVLTEIVEIFSRGGTVIILPPHLRKPWLSISLN